MSEQPVPEWVRVPPEVIEKVREALTTILNCCWRSRNAPNVLDTIDFVARAALSALDRATEGK